MTAASRSVGLRLRAILSFQSDWHVGAGGGRFGALDSLVARDADGLPFVPATTLRGVLRDAGEHAARALDDGEPAGPWQSFLTALFGDEPTRGGGRSPAAPVAGIIAVEEARIAEPLRSLLLRPDSRPLAAALTFVKAGVKIDPRTGAAESEMLRFDEVARRGMRLEALITVPVPVGAAPATVAFLHAAASLLTRIGAKRRRGLGAVTVSLEPLQPAAFDPPLPLAGPEAASILAALEGPPTIGTPPERPPAVVSTAAEEGGDFEDFPIHLSLETPTLIASAVEGNVVVGDDRISGHHLLPALKPLLTRAGVAGFDDLVATADVRLLPAYPTVDGGRGMPVPLSWQRPKSEAATAAVSDSLVDAPSVGEQQMKPVGSGYVRRVGTQMRHLRMPRKVLSTHNTIDDHLQKPTSAIGGVYVYEALAGRQAFEARLRVRKSIAGRWPAEWWMDAAGHVRVGRARHSGFGRLHVSFGAPVASTDSHTTLAAGDTLHVLLESDAVLLGASLDGEVSLEALAAALCETAGLPHSPFDLAASRSVLRARRFDGWSVGIGLPRATLQTVQAGSVARLHLHEELPAEAQALIEAEGIGELRALGFGAVRLGDPLAGNPGPLAEVKPEDAVSARVALPLAATDDPFAAGVEEAAWRDYVAAAIESFVSNRERIEKEFSWTATLPRPSQLAGLREAVATADGAAIARGLHFLSSRLAKKATSERTASWQGRDKKVRALLEDAESVWGLLADAHSEPPEPLRVASDMRRQLAPWAVSSLVTSVIQACKRWGETAPGGRAQED